MYSESDIYFYDADNRIITQCEGLKRNQSQSERMCLRTLKHPRDPRWKSVKRIVTYSDGKMIRDVKLI